MSNINDNLPPGVTRQMIDDLTPEVKCDHCGDMESSGHIKECKECGDCVCRDCYNKEKEQCEACAKLSPCCGVEFDEDIRICPHCKEHV